MALQLFVQRKIGLHAFAFRPTPKQHFEPALVPNATDAKEKL